MKNLSGFSLNLFSADYIDSDDNFGYISLPFIRFNTHRPFFFCIDLFNVEWKDRFRFCILEIGEWSLFRVFWSEYWKIDLTILGIKILSIKNK